MHIFIDTANINEIEAACKYGYVSGVTTNPSLIAKEAGNAYEILQHICRIVDGPVNAEVLAEDAVGMIAEAREYAAIASNIVIKVPMTGDGLQAVNTLNKENIQTNVTLVFSANQAILAARAGATYVSPFVGRIDDIGHDGIEVVRQISNIFHKHSIECKIIAASIRHPAHVTAAALAEADIATIPFSVLAKMIKHPLTDLGIERFLTDWKNSIK